VPNGALRFTPDLARSNSPTCTRSSGSLRVPVAGAKTRRHHSSKMATAVVWKMNADKSLEPVPDQTGNYRSHTTEVAQVTKGSLNPKDQLVRRSHGS